MMAKMGGGMGDFLRDAQKQAMDMQRKMAKLQEDLAQRVVEGTAGGGMVKARMSGSKELLGITIDKEAVDPNDVEMLQDLVVAAVNEAARRVDEAMQSQLGAMMPPGMKLPGM